LRRDLEFRKVVEVQWLVAQSAELIVEPLLIIPQRRSRLVDLDLTSYDASFVELKVPP